MSSALNFRSTHSPQIDVTRAVTTNWSHTHIVLILLLVVPGLGCGGDETNSGGSSNELGDTSVSVGNDTTVDVGASGDGSNSGVQDSAAGDVQTDVDPGADSVGEDATREDSTGEDLDDSDVFEDTQQVVDEDVGCVDDTDCRLPIDDLCMACTEDTECGGGADLCLTVGDYSGCSVDCSGGFECPSGFECVEIEEADTVIAEQCYPTGPSFLDECDVCGGSGPPTWYADTDGDDLGDPEAAIEACEQPANHVDNPSDTEPNCRTNDTDQCDVCGGDDSSCLDCGGVLSGTAVVDDCDVCSGGTTGHEANSDMDCAGVCSGGAALDDCEVCSGGTSGHDANSDMDCAGVCSGSALADDCEVCSGGTTGIVADADKDCLGVCFGDAVRDCAEVCNGAATIDGCDLCSGGTSGHGADSDMDCAGECFGDATLDCEGSCGGAVALDCAGECGGAAVLDCNGDCDGAAVVDCNGDCGGTAFIDNCGVCAAGNTGHLADSDMDCAGVCDGEAQLDCLSQCNGTAAIDCSGVCGGTASLDDCSVCSGGTSGHLANSDQDCLGACFGDATIDCADECLGTAVVDECSVCSGGTSGHLANSDKDCAGACFGGALLDCFNVCEGGAIVDNCGDCGGNGAGCTDCNGDVDGTAFLDDCGVCSAGATGHAANSDQDCAGDCFGTAAFDDCTVCSGGTADHVANSDQDCAGTCFGTATFDCDGACDGTATSDNCGVCDAVPGNDCVQDCANVWGGGATLDNCDVCDLDPGNDCVQDCADTWGGSATVDSCDVCSGGTTGHLADSDRDCSGTCFGTATVDDCSVCSGGTTGHTANSDQDCAGACFGSAIDDCAGDCNGTAINDNCGVCDTNPGNDCVQDCAGVWGGPAALDDCSICSGGATGHAANSDKDCADECFGSASFDTCTVCSGGTSGHVADSDKDCAGACFGAAVEDCAGDCAGTATTDNCAVCDADSGNDCVQDCADVWGGLAVYDDCAVCSGGTTGHTYNSDWDCVDVCFGTATLDSCTVCSGGTTGHIADSDQDCAGACFGTATVDCAADCGGTATVDNCGVCDTDPGNDCTDDCNGDSGGTAVLDDCSVCSGGNSGHGANSDQDCNGDCFGTALLDDCTICSGGATGHVANSDQDCALTCFGTAVEDCAGTCEGTATADMCAVCDPDPGNDCVQDCNDEWGGTAAIDACGVCAGGSTGLVTDADIDACGNCFGPGEDIWYADTDFDGFGDPDVSQFGCEPATGSWTLDSTDCEDGIPEINPDAVEQIGDEVDQNCDDIELCLLDADLDGFWSGQGRLPILILDDTAIEYEASSAALLLGITPTVVNDGDAFVSAYSDGTSWSLLIIDAQNAISASGFDAALQAHLDAGLPIIYGEIGLEANAARQAILGLICDGTSLPQARSLEPVDGSSVNLFDYIFGVQPFQYIRGRRPVTGGVAHVICTADTGPSEAFVEVEYAVGLYQTVTVTAHSEQVIHNGFLMHHYGDPAGEGLAIHVLVANEIALALGNIISSDATCDDPGEAALSDFGDCDDSLGYVNPDAAEVIDDGFDYDCDGIELCFVDGDDDGYRESEGTQLSVLMFGSAVFLPIGEWVGATIQQTSDAADFAALYDSGDYDIIVSVPITRPPEVIAVLDEHINVRARPALVSSFRTNDPEQMAILDLADPSASLRPCGGSMAPGAPFDALDYVARTGVVPTACLGYTAVDGWPLIEEVFSSETIALVTHAGRVIVNGFSLQTSSHNILLANELAYLIGHYQDEGLANGWLVDSGDFDCQDPGEGTASNLASDCNDDAVDINVDQDDLPDASFIDKNCDGIDGDMDLAYFVTPLGSLDLCSFQTPCASIQAAIDRNSLGRSQIYVASMPGETTVYPEYVSLDDGDSIYGFYSADDWSRSTDNVAVIDSPGQVGLYVNQYSGTGEIVGMTIRASDGSSDGDYSSTAVRARSVTGSLTIDSCVLEAGQGANGSRGSAGGAGVDGDNGLDGQSGAAATTYASPGQGGDSCVGADGGAGGAGGAYGYTLDGGPGSGLSGGSGGDGYWLVNVACSAVNGTNATANGSDGAVVGITTVDSEQARGSGVADAWRALVGRNGRTGLYGRPGSGGGGGGGCRYQTISGIDRRARGGAGGGGGGGACGGGGGDGGFGGGGSIALWIDDAADGLVVSNCTLVTAGGGTGGNGSNGNIGGTGGTNGDGGAGQTRTNSVGGDGGDGSDGGDGGHGGGGGGGGGGMSTGIYVESGAEPTIVSSTFVIGGVDDPADPGTLIGGVPGNGGCGNTYLVNGFRVCNIVTPVRGPTGANGLLCSIFDEADATAAACSSP